MAEMLLILWELLNNGDDMVRNFLWNQFKIALSNQQLFKEIIVCFKDEKPHFSAGACNAIRRVYSCLSTGGFFFCPLIGAFLTFLVPEMVLLVAVVRETTMLDAAVGDDMVECLHVETVTIPILAFLEIPQWMIYSTAVSLCTALWP